METSYAARPRPSLSGAILSMAAAICLVGGVASLIDAADGWQDILNHASQTAVAYLQTCPNQWSVSGWGDGAVLLLAAAALVLLGVSSFAATRGHTWSVRGQAAALAAIVPVVLLWVDAGMVAGSSIGDCDGVGLSGTASAAINRAGWLFLAAIILCFIAWGSFRPKASQPWNL